MNITTVEDPGPCLRLRREVFVEELGIPEHLEFPGDEHAALHLLATQAAEPVGTARVVISGGFAKLGHLCVSPRARGQGVGRALVRAAIAVAGGQRATRLGLLAVPEAVGLYAGEGFFAREAPREIAGRPHQYMEYTL